MSKLTLPQLDRYVSAHRQHVTSVENWWDKYRVTACNIETDRDAAASRLAGYLRDLGYAS